MRTFETKKQGHQWAHEKKPVNTVVRRQQCVENRKKKCRAKVN